jgi:diketogulonate reductase-like aldo/keto reductase
LLKNEVINKIAARLGRTPAQILLRWALEKGELNENVDFFFYFS